MRASRLRRNPVSSKTEEAGAKTPISFFSPLKLMPVFPPTDALYHGKVVVGMLMYAMPRLKVAAAKPPRSVTIPPPRFIKSEWRVAPCSLRACHTEARVSRFLCTSSAPIMISAAFSVRGCCSCGRQKAVCMFVGKDEKLVVRTFSDGMRQVVFNSLQRITSCLLI